MSFYLGSFLKIMCNLDHKGPVISLKEMIQDASPIYIAFLFSGISVGALSYNYHLTSIQTIFISALLFAIPLIVMLMHAISVHLSLWVIVVLTVMINFRFVFMSATLYPYFSTIPLRKILPNLFYLSNSYFTVSFLKFRNNKGMDYFLYYVFIGLSSSIVFLICVMIGYFLMQNSQSIWLNYFLVMMLPIHFTALKSKHWPKLKKICATFFGFLLVPFFMIYKSITKIELIQILTLLTTFLLSIKISKPIWTFLMVISLYGILLCFCI